MSYDCPIGGFGEVWKCQWHDTTGSFHSLYNATTIVLLTRIHPLSVAVKKLLLHWITSSESSKQDFDREVAFLRSVRHPNIVLFYGAGALEVSKLQQLFVEGE